MASWPHRVCACGLAPKRQSYNRMLFIRALHKGQAHLAGREGTVFLGSWGRGGWVLGVRFWFLWVNLGGMTTFWPALLAVTSLSIPSPSVVWKGESMSEEGWRLCRRQPLYHGWPLRFSLTSWKALAPPRKPRTEQDPSRPHPDPPDTAAFTACFTETWYRYALHRTCMLLPNLLLCPPTLSDSGVSRLTSMWTGAC